MEVYRRFLTIRAGLSDSEAPVEGKVCMCRGRVTVSVCWRHSNCIFC